MPFNGVDLKKSTDQIKNDKAIIDKDIEGINQVFSGYYMHVYQYSQAAQLIRYYLRLPDDIKDQGRVRKATKDIEYSLGIALNTDNFRMTKEGASIVIEKQGRFNVVRFGDVYTVPFFDSSKDLAVALGKDMNGKRFSFNIDKAPHVLIAGTTGSGKSETIHTIIASLLMDYYYGPDCIGIGIIDMKGTEFNKYKDAYPVSIVSDPYGAIDLLRQMCDLMDARYKMLTQAGCDDIAEYLAKGNKMTRIVIIIDELADLIMQNKSVEKYIVRIAQKARACGIHLVIGTQRPSADVVTGLIKANIPYRIALNVANSTNSRIILDENGAEKLLGKGDMLVKDGGKPAVRVQGAFVDDEDKIALNNLLSNGKHFQLSPVYLTRWQRLLCRITRTPVY